MLNPLSFPWQIWESVPYLASYVSPVLKEGRSIPLLPQELEVAWNGKSRCATGSTCCARRGQGASPARWRVAQQGRTSPGLQEARKGLSAGLPGLFPLPVPRGSSACCFHPLPTAPSLPWCVWGARQGSAAGPGWAAARAAPLALTILGNAAAPDLAGPVRNSSALLRLLPVGRRARPQPSPAPSRACTAGGALLAP